jgi:zinc-ribbon domain
MTCSQCGAQNLAEAAFCTKCGSALSQQPPTQPPTQVPGTPVPPYTPLPPYTPVPPPGSPAPATGAQFQFDLRRLTIFDKAIAVASLVVFISVFLPWYGVPGYSVSGESWHGYLIIPVLTAIVLIGYLVLRAGGIAMRLPIAHAPLLIIGTGLQLLIVVLGFFDNPDGTSDQFGAYFGLLAAVVACGVIAVPAIQSMQQRS